MAILFSMYICNVQAEIKWLDLLAFCGYKYFGWEGFHWCYEITCKYYLKCGVIHLFWNLLGNPQCSPTVRPITRYSSNVTHSKGSSLHLYTEQELTYELMWHWHGSESQSLIRDCAYYRLNDFNLIYFFFLLKDDCQLSWRTCVPFCWLLPHTTVDEYQHWIFYGTVIY